MGFVNPLITGKPHIVTVVGPQPIAKWYDEHPKQEKQQHILGSTHGSAQSLMHSSG